MKIKKLATGLVLFSCVVGSASAADYGDVAIEKCLSIKKLMIENKGIYLGFSDRDWRKWLQVTKKSFRSAFAEGIDEFNDYKDIVEEACKFVPVDVMLGGGLSFKPPAGSDRALQNYKPRSSYGNGLRSIETEAPHGDDN